MTQAAAPPPPPSSAAPSQPSPLARTVALDLVTRLRLRLTDPRDSRLGELGTAGYELGAASWTGRQATFVGFYTPSPDPAIAGPDLAGRCAAAARWGNQRLTVQGAERCDILLVALGPVSGSLTAPPSTEAVHIGAVAVDPASADLSVLLPPGANVPTPREIRSRAEALRSGHEPPTLAAVDLAERQSVAAGYAQPAKQQLVSAPVATYSLIAAFVLVFVIEKVVIRGQFSDQGLYDMGALPSPPTDWWRFISSALLHDPSGGLAGLGQIPAHLLFNCLAMFFVGRLVEQLHGRLVLVVTFLISAIGGGLLWVGYNAATNAPLGLSIGASGGILGLLGLMLMLGRIQGKDVPVGIAHAMRQYVITYGVLLVLFTLLSSGGNVSTTNNLAHIGGALTGVALGCMLPPLRRVGGRDLKTWERAATIVVLALCAAALVFAAVNVIGNLGTSPGFRTNQVTLQP